jgi:3-oxoacyl-[acyl-carrier-protein] synthase-1
MRRVVVTGLGIVSSIGTGQDEVTASLRDAKSGVVAAPDHIQHGFRSQVWAPPSLGVTAEDWAPLVDRRAARFLANGTAWGHIAFEEALKDSGMTADEIKSDRIGVIVGEGGPSTQIILQAAETTKEKGSPKRIGPFAVPKAMASGPSAVLATWFELRGVNYSISSACATSAHCIGAAAEQIAWGKQDVVFAGGVEDIDWSMSNMFDAMGAMSSNYNDTPSVASRAYDRPATASSSPAARASWCWKNTSGPWRAARPSTPRSPATAPTPTATTWSLPRARAPSAA